MPGKACVTSVFSIVVAAGALCWLAPLQGLEASAETYATSVSVSTQLFDATPVGGALHTMSPARRTGETHQNQDVRAQIFDPDVFGGVRSKFSGTERIASGPDSQTEGRSVATSDRLRTTPVLDISPGPARQCEPGPSTRKHEPQYGELVRNHAAG
jgi:hypothetical protein